VRLFTLASGPEYINPHSPPMLFIADSSKTAEFPEYVNPILG